ncbi:MAG: nucleoside deaminase [Bacteroidales bacterium]
MGILLSDEYFMQQALTEARKALEKDEIPMGAIITIEDQIIARAHNLTETLHDVTAHAEMQAITSAANALGSKYLKNCTLYVTAEPCVMCGGAAYWAQLKRVVYGAADNKRGISQQPGDILHPKTQLVGGILKEECSKLLSDFFRMKR